MPLPHCWPPPDFMKRLLLSAYARLVPAPLKRLIPTRFKAWLAGYFYRITLHPDLGFQHVRQLRQLGQTIKAAQQYADPGTIWTEETAEHVTTDPLFRSILTPTITAQSGNTDAAASGYFQAEFGYRGLLISGVVQSRAKPQPTHIEIMLDDTILRPEKLRFSKSGARFRYIIQRKTLDIFPQHSQLRVRTSSMAFLPLNHKYQTFDLHLPHGRGGIFANLTTTGTLDKKGSLRLSGTEISARQDRYLDLYTRVRLAFKHSFNKPLFILYGTLLGQHRGQDFIPGDDDFDVGYVSDHTTPAAIKAETIDIIKTLVTQGFHISLNAEGKPFRIGDHDSGPAIYLDNRPVFSCNDGHIWLHKHARLKLRLDDFRAAQPAMLRDVEVLIPRATEDFLAAYYGPGWAIPDPGFSNANKTISPEITQRLGAINLTIQEQRQLAATHGAGFFPLALRSLYPLG